MKTQQVLDSNIKSHARIALGKGTVSRAGLVRLLLKNGFIPRGVRVS
jgi:hypothetical protein